MGRIFTARERNSKLKSIDITVKILGFNFENPSEYFMPIAHAVSNIPAIIKLIHAIEDYPFTIV